MNAAPATLPFGILPVSAPHLALKAARAEHTNALADLRRVIGQVQRVIARGEETVTPALAIRARDARARLVAAQAAHNAAASALGLAL